MIKVVIDTDPGTDDALALMMALNSPDLDVQGLTTVGGNASLAHTTRNALRLLEQLGRPEIPVSRGAARPLTGKFHYGYYYHGAGGLTVRLTRTGSEPRPLRAPEYMASLAYSFPGELVLIALGPLTNIARALTSEPRLKEWVKEIVIMGGAVEVPGNVSQFAEFNFYNDPLAAGKVLASGIPITLVGLDVCNSVNFTRDEKVWLHCESKSEALAVEMLSGWFAMHSGSDSYNLSDPLAVVAAVQPDLMLYKQASVQVEVDDEERIGKTTARYSEGNVKVAVSVRAREAKELIRTLLRSRVP